MTTNNEKLAKVREAAQWVIRALAGTDRASILDSRYLSDIVVFAIEQSQPKCEAEKEPYPVGVDAGYEREEWHKKHDKPDLVTMKRAEVEDIKHCLLQIQKTTEGLNVYQIYCKEALSILEAALEKK